MNINVSEFLKDFTTDLPDTIRAGEIIKLTYSADMKHISFFALYDSILPAEDIFAFEKTLEKRRQTAVNVEKLF